MEKVGDGAGTVTSDDGKINCGEVCEATYQDQVLTSGKLMVNMVTLTAIPDEGSVFTFAGWGQDCGCAQAVDRSGAGFDPNTCAIPIIMGETRRCTATFGLPVGGIAVPVNKLGLVSSWLGVAALASLAALTVALVRRRGG